MLQYTVASLLSVVTGATVHTSNYNQLKINIADAAVFLFPKLKYKSYGIGSLFSLYLQINADDVFCAKIKTRKACLIRCLMYSLEECLCFITVLLT